MANQITDNTTSLTTAESATGWDNLAGSASGTLDNEIFIEGSNSMAYYTTNTRDGLLFDNGSVNTAFANKVFYIWVNCGVAGLLATKAAGGMTVRFCGNTVTDWFEVYVAGSDDYPPAISGGWVLFAVDIEEAHLNSSNTNGTKPATNAIRYVGISTVTGGTMPRMADNTWIDQIRYLDNSGATPGIIVEGRNGGSTDWDSADIFTQLGDAAGLFVPTAGGAWKINTPIQFGIADASTHAFTDTNSIWLWDNQEFLADGFYNISAINDTGTNTVTFGSKTGTGDDASGSQGLTIAADPTGVRWDMDFQDTDLDGALLYGCSFQHGGDFLLNNAVVSVISSLYIDCTSALVTGSEQLRNAIINANTADGVAFMTTTTLDDIVFCSFEFSDGHGIELTTPQDAIQASKGNTFTGYAAQGGTANDRALYNNSGSGTVTINVTDGGSDISYRNGASADTVIVLNPVTFKLIVSDIDDNSLIQNASCIIRAGATGPLTYQASVSSLSRSGTTATASITAHGLSVGDKFVLEGVDENEWMRKVWTVATSADANTITFTVAGTETTPAGVTSATMTAVILSGLTDVNGEIEDARSYASDQDYEGWVRDSTPPAPYYQQSPLSGTMDKDTGITINVPLIEN